ncbi:hypothetical protein PAL_GLEAN10002251 [Pteropus alecto]|uniref:Uncharacterized protein n=1 Tax=Pteropus alecto TaxID=9402 RepID=L5JZR0_PTEAL|nr:hypothetical protein PAL_GLEAN10002251 [Pteropus alecto]
MIPESFHLCIYSSDFGVSPPSLALCMALQGTLPGLCAAALGGQSGLNALHFIVSLTNGEPCSGTWVARDPNDRVSVAETQAATCNTGGSLWLSSSLGGSGKATVDTSPVL